MEGRRTGGEAGSVTSAPMTGRAFLPDDGSAVRLAAEGLAAAHPELVRVVPDPLHLVARRRAPGRRVGLVSGGGSGHEPLHSGFLGPGMLDAVAPGQVFASPHNRQILEASRAAAGPEGVLHIVKNYTGDRINFGIAAERLRNEGIDVARVLVDDDLATELDTAATGRRGTAATVVVEKLVGAAADAGMGLGKVAAVGERVVAASRSLAVAARAHTGLQTGQPAFALGPGELEHGVGIHGERAASTVARLPLDELVEDMVGRLWDALGGPAEVLLVVNGLGSATGLELHALRALAGAALARRGCTVQGSLVGTWVAALDMHGFSLTLTALEPGWLELWQAPAVTPALVVTGPGR